jgi:hypothetical protein
MIVRINRRKIWLTSRRPVPTFGKSWPTSAPTTIETMIQVVRERLRAA